MEVHSQTPRFTNGWPRNPIVRMVLDVIECEKDPLVSVQLNRKCDTEHDSETQFILVLSHGRCGFEPEDSFDFSRRQRYYFYPVDVGDRNLITGCSRKQELMSYCTDKFNQTSPCTYLSKPLPVKNSSIVASSSLYLLAEISTVQSPHSVDPRARINTVRVTV